MSTQPQTWMTKDINKDDSLHAENPRRPQLYTHTQKNKRYRELSKAERGRGIPPHRKSTPIGNQVLDGQPRKHVYK